MLASDRAVLENARRMVAEQREQLSKRSRWRVAFERWEELLDLAAAVESQAPGRPDPARRPGGLHLVPNAGPPRFPERGGIRSDE